LPVTDRVWLCHRLTEIFGYILLSS